MGTTALAVSMPYYFCIHWLWDILEQFEIENQVSFHISLEHVVDQVKYGWNSKRDTELLE